MNIPRRWQGYACSEYFSGVWSSRGHLDEPSQTLVIVPINDVYELAEHQFFAIGRSGADGIDFGYRKGESGIWAFYPMQQRFKFMASDIQALVDGWRSGKLTV